MARIKAKRAAAMANRTPGAKPDGLARELSRSQLRSLGWRGLSKQAAEQSLMKVAAQRGLAPYVYALQLFNEWLAENPGLQAQLEPKLRELGLWDIRLANPALLEPVE